MFVGLACCVTQPLAAGVEGYYRFPAIHDDTIVFSAEGDLWKVGTAGGLAIRLTSHPGHELFSKISPDGKQLAFSGEYQGNRDVFVVSIDGGEPRRQTFHPGNDEVVAWRPDSESVVFRTRRYSFSWSGYALLEVPVNGGQPKEIRIGPAALASFSPDGQSIAFNRFSREFRNWKRYYGGRAQEIWVGNFEKNEFARVTSWKGTDRFPMWSEDKIYFASDRDGTMNIYRMRVDGQDVEAVTQHQYYDVRWPDLHGSNIVYMLGGDLWIVDTATATPRKIDIEIPSDRVRYQTRFESPGKTLRSFALDPEGKKIILAARGEIWVTHTKKGRRLQLTHSSGVRERAPAVSPDGKRLALISDSTGEQEVALLDIVGGDKPKTLTRRKKGWIFGPIWSPAGTHLAYADLTLGLFLVDVASGEVALVDRSEDREIREYTFSPDGAWLAYTKPEVNKHSTIYIHNIAEQRSYAVTTSFTVDRSPTWDPKGRFLYFLSARSVNPFHGELDYQYVVPLAYRPYALILAKDGRSPFLPHELLEASMEEDSAKDEDAAEDEDEENDDDPEAASEAKRTEEGGGVGSSQGQLREVRVDIEGISSRVVAFPVRAEEYRSLQAIHGGVLYVKQPMEGRRGAFDKEAKRQLLRFDLKKRKETVYVADVEAYTLSGNRKRIAYRLGSKIHVQSLKKKPEKGDEEIIDAAKFSLRVKPAEEFEQIFVEAWRLQRDFYWAENLAGIDWEGMRVKYEVLLPRVGTRHELNDLIGQMFAELGTSHTYVSGGDVEEAKTVGVGLLGAVVEVEEESGLHRFLRVLRPEVWETDVAAPLTVNHADVQDGEFLFAVDGQSLTPQDNVYDLLANRAEEQVLLTVGRQADRSDARDVQVETLATERRLLLRDWCRRNREYVDKVSEGRIGYLHIPDMGGQGLVEFTRAFYPQLRREGLIIDVRYNGGGNVSQLIIDRLRRQLWAYMAPRRGTPNTYPYRVHIGHKVVLTNQNAGSDGDIFPESFQTLGLGPVIGMRSWGGVVGIRRDKPFIDGGMSAQPEFAWWRPGKGWDLENHGVDPDIEIDLLPTDWIAGRDPQLDRGISELEKKIRESPVRFHEEPPVPDKSKSAGR